MIDAVVQWLSTFPPSAQGALVALVGVFVTLAINVGVTALQLWSGRRDRQTDRAHQLKKDVYLEFAADYRESLAAFNHLSDPNFPLQKVNEVAQKAVRSYAKITLIAPAKTVEKLAKLNVLMANRFMELTPDAVALRYRQTDMDLSIKAIQEIQGEQAGIISLMREYNASGVSDPEKFEYLKNWFENTRSSYDEEVKLRDSHMEAVRSKQSDLSLKIMKNLESIEPELNSLLAMIRVDIGIDRDDGRAFQSANSAVDHEALRQKFIEQGDRVRKIDEVP